MTKRLEGKVAIVTGGGGGMGGAQAMLFAKEGASICVADINKAAAECVAQQIVENGGNAIGLELDVRQSAAWKGAVLETEGSFGPMTTLCNNAGANFRVSFEEQTEDQWQTIMEIGLTGAFLGIKAVVPSMRKAGSGVILNMGSLASVRPGDGGHGQYTGGHGCLCLVVVFACRHCPHESSGKG